MVVTCMMTLVTKIGPEHQKGTITGIFRSLGALARASGPIVASAGNSNIVDRSLVFCARVYICIYILLISILIFNF